MTYTNSIKDIHYVWLTFGEPRMQTSKEFLPPRTVLGNNVSSLVLNLSSSWTKVEYMKWLQHWKKVYKELSRGIRLAKKWRKTSLISHEPQEVSKARSKELLEMSVLASELLNIRKQAKILADYAYRHSK